MKPEPLNLDIQFKANLTYKWGNEYDFINFKKGYEKGFSEAQKVILKIVKQRTKSACEFYLRYKDRPDLFEKEQKDLIDYDTWDFRHHTFVILKGNRASEYNLWLFKLAFKDVLGGDTNKPEGSG